MKRIAVVMLVGLVMGALPAEAGAEGGVKTYEGTYTAPGPGGCAMGAGHRVCAYAWDCRYSNSGCALVDLERPARRISIEIADESGMPVFARVHAFGWSEPLAEICALPGEPIRMNAMGVSELIVHIVNGTCPDSTPSAPTTGVVRVTRV